MTPVSNPGERGRDVTLDVSVHPQDSSIGRVGVVREAIKEASQQAGAYVSVDLAVAYASTKGVIMLTDDLAGRRWDAARKRFLVSFDFGFTEPEALARLGRLDNAEVRIPNGRAVVASPTLQPPSAFHAKVFAFRGGQSEVLALVVGSANLTASALSTGAEVVTKQVWLEQSQSHDPVGRAQALASWFDDAWDAADSLGDVLDEYRERRRRMPSRPKLREERTDATRMYVANTEENVIVGPLPVQLASAKALWIDASSMIHNRPGRLPGSQLNTPRGTRVFFGFGAENVPRDTTLGGVFIRIPGYDHVHRTIRFSNNSMDVVNLPIPDHHGLETYEGRHLIFERESPLADGEGRFTLRVTDASGIAAAKVHAANSIDLTMRSRRRYGLLF